jgi:hypothetical protein
VREKREASLMREFMEEGRPLRERCVVPPIIEFKERGSIIKSV